MDRHHEIARHHAKGVGIRLERETVDAPLHDIIDFSEIPNAVLQGTDGYRLEEEENRTTIVVVKRQGQVADNAKVDTQENELARRDFRDLARATAGLDVAASQLSVGIGEYGRASWRERGGT